LFRDCQKAGAKIIVIDPRETVPAKEADVWAQIRPGTDTAPLAMIDVIRSLEFHLKAIEGSTVRICSRRHQEPNLLPRYSHHFRFGLNRLW
jgi:predicted molibdopterin-dependent oxidoreductase YjgC